MTERDKLMKATIVGPWQHGGNDGKVSVNGTLTSLYDYVVRVVKDDIANNGTISQALKSVPTSK